MKRCLLIGLCVLLVGCAETQQITPRFKLIELRFYPLLDSGKRYSVICLASKDRVQQGIYDCDVGEMLR